MVDALFMVLIELGENGSLMEERERTEERQRVELKDDGGGEKFHTCELIVTP